MSTANFTVVIFEEHLGLPQKHRGSHVDELDDDGRTTRARSAASVRNRRRRVPILPGR